MYNKSKKISCIILYVLIAFQIKAQCSLTINLGADTAICPSTSFSIQLPNNFDSYLWQDSSTVPEYTIEDEGLYYSTVSYFDSSFNLIFNGDFELGNTGFTTDYIYYPIADVFGPQGSYGILNNANTWFAPFGPCTDHSSGIGNMLIADGSAFNNGNDALWCQTLQVQPNTDYDFSYWIQNVSSAPLPEIRVEFNGVELGVDISGQNLCDWQKRNYLWSNGIDTSLTICLYDNVLLTFGNDFAIDDIKLSPYCTITDSIQVTLLDYDMEFLLDSICEGDSAFIAGDWRFESGTYIDTLNSGVCGTIISNELIVFDNPTADAGIDTTINYGDSLNLNAIDVFANYVYEWLGDDGSMFSGPSIQPSIFDTTSFILTVLNFGCIDVDTIQINVLPEPPEPPLPPIPLEPQDALIPNAFSPNGDSWNNTFGIINSDQFDEIHLVIYNRWGEIVFKERSSNPQWNGAKNGKDLNPDNYYYFIKTIRSSGATSDHKGEVYLMR